MHLVQRGDEHDQIVLEMAEAGHGCHTEQFVDSALLEALYNLKHRLRLIHKQREKTGEEVFSRFVLQLIVKHCFVKTYFGSHGTQRHAKYFSVQN